MKTPGQFSAEINSQNQIERDKGHFHITIINPDELQQLRKPERARLDRLSGSSLDVELVGLGAATRGPSESFFVVCESEDAHRVRVGFDLPHKDFHITLGFAPNDVHEVAKDRGSLVRAGSLRLEGE